MKTTPPDARHAEQESAQTSAECQQSSVRESSCPEGSSSNTGVLLSSGHSGVVGKTMLTPPTPPEVGKSCASASQPQPYCIQVQTDVSGMVSVQTQFKEDVALDSLPGHGQRDSADVVTGTVSVQTQFKEDVALDSLPGRGQRDSADVVTGTVSVQTQFKEDVALDSLPGRGQRNSAGVVVSTQENQAVGGSGTTGQVLISQNKAVGESLVQQTGSRGWVEAVDGTTPSVECGSVQEGVVHSHRQGMEDDGAGQTMECGSVREGVVHSHRQGMEDAAGQTMEGVECAEQHPAQSCVSSHKESGLEIHGEDQ